MTSSDSTSPIYMAYYSNDRVYLDAADRLEQSLKRFDLPYRLIPGPSADWLNACRAVPKAAYEAYREEGRPVVWLDADAEIVAKPTWFDHAAGYVHFALHHFQKRDRWRTGTMFFNDTPGGKEVLQRWALAMSHMPENWTGQALMRALKPDYMQLPVEYCCIPDIDECSHPVIIHHQASRQWKGKKGQI